MKINCPRSNRIPNFTRYALVSSLALLIFLTGYSNQEKEIKTTTTIRKTALSERPSAIDVDVFKLSQTNFQKKVRIPGELSAFETVDVYPKIEGFIQRVYVDRGSTVHQGQLLAQLVAPELEAKIVEARSKVKEADAADAEALAKYTSEQGIYSRLQEASQVAGVISENELATAKMSVQAAKAHVQALQGARMASLANVHSLSEIKDYLQIRSPISGIVAKRNLHPGALVGPSGAGAAASILQIQQINHLRLLVSIPERYYAGVKLGGQIAFSVSAYPGRTFTGIVSRPAYSLDEKNRTEIVELDVNNADFALSPGMYAEVQWPIVRKAATFMVPNSAVVTTAEHTFVERVLNDKVEWVEVQKGFPDGERIEVFGNLQPGDLIVSSGSDEYRNGAIVAPRMTTPENK